MELLALYKGFLNSRVWIFDALIICRGPLLGSGCLIGWQTCWVLGGLRAGFVGLAMFHWLANWSVCWVGLAGLGCVG